MNIENVRKVIELIKANAHDFNMDSSRVHKCDTPACIAGFAAKLSASKYDELQPICANDTSWEELLGITEWQALDLYYPDDGDSLWGNYYAYTNRELPGKMSDMSASDAIELLELLIQNEVPFAKRWHELKDTWVKQ